MIKYRLKVNRRFRLKGWPCDEACVFVRVTVPDVDAEICYEGPELLIEEIKMELIGSYGLRGRAIGEWTTGYNLDITMNSWIMAPFDPELVEGLNILEKDQSDL